MAPILPEYLLKKSDGNMRRVGFEIEFSGLTFDQCLSLLAREPGGHVDRDSEVEATIKNERLGDFHLELDWQFLKDQAKQEENDNELISLAADLASKVVPIELVCPPIDIDNLDSLQATIDALRAAGAKGTDDSFLNAFGVHINVDIPDLEAKTIIRYLKAYCVLQDYLVDAHAIDLSRKLLPYVDLYDESYIRTVLDYEDPDTDKLIQDYIEFNPTRNRALDMLPIFSTIDETFIQSKLDDPRIQARPAFHYRMPNCRIEDPSWNFETDWRIWCLVDVIANDRDSLSFLASEYSKWLDGQHASNGSNWAEFIKDWMDKHLQE